MQYLANLQNRAIPVLNNHIYTPFLLSFQSVSTHRDIRSAFSRTFKFIRTFKVSNTFFQLTLVHKYKRSVFFTRFLSTRSTFSFHLTIEQSTRKLSFLTNLLRNQMQKFFFQLIQQFPGKFNETSELRTLENRIERIRRRGRDLLAFILLCQSKERQ